MKHFCDQGPEKSPCGDAKACWHCYLFAYSRPHNLRWGGDGNVAWCGKLLSAAEFHERKTGRKLPAPQRKPKRAPCRHLGADTGERRECLACGTNRDGTKAKVRIKLLVCEIHGSCTVARNVGVACCGNCKDYASWKETEKAS